MENRNRSRVHLRPLAFLFVSCLAFHAVHAQATNLPKGTLPLTGFSALVDFSIPGPCHNLLSKDGGVLVSSSPVLTVAECKIKLYETPLIAETETLPDWSILGTESGSVYRYSEEHDTYECLFSLDSPINGVSASRDGRIIAIVAGGRGYLRDMNTGNMTELDISLLNTGGTIGGITLNADASMMIVHINVSGMEDSWSYDFLVERDSMKPILTLDSYSQTSFTPDGKHLYKVGYDYSYKNSDGNSYESFIVFDFSGKEIVNVSYPMNQASESRRDERFDRYYAKDKRLLASLPFLGWSEFGMQTGVWLPKADTTGREYDIKNILPGAVKAPDLGEYLSYHRNQQQNFYNGFIATNAEDYSSVTILRLAAEDIGKFSANASDILSNVTPVWSKQLISESSSIYMCSLAVPEQNVVVVYLPKSHASSDRTYIASVPFLRLVNWDTGKAIGKDLDLSGSNSYSVQTVGPDVSYIIMKTNSSEYWNIYWPKTGIFRAWTGTKLYRGTGIAEFAPTVSGCVTFESEGKRYWIPAAEGQIGNVISLAVNPSQTLFAALDEAGNFYIRSVLSGATVFASRFVPGLDGIPTLEKAPPANIEKQTGAASSIKQLSSGNPLKTVKVWITSIPLSSSDE